MIIFMKAEQIYLRSGRYKGCITASSKEEALKYIRSGCFAIGTYIVEDTSTREQFPLISQRSCEYFGIKEYDMMKFTR